MEKSEIEVMIAALEGAATLASAGKTDHAPGDLSYKVIANDIISYHIGQYKSMLPFFLEMKVQVDRWDLAINNWLINYSIKPFVLHSMKNHINKVVNKETGATEYLLWGGEITFTPDIQIDKIIAIDSNHMSYDDMRYACLGKVSLPDIQRMIDMKAFW